MEQRIGSVSPSVHAAGTDPAYIPGLTPPGSAGAEETAQEETPQQPPRDAAPEEAAGARKESEEEPGGREEEEEEVRADGPVFEVFDHRGSVTAGPAGVTFRLDGEEAAFRWKEIGAVEIGTSRFGRWFTVTVYTVDRRWYQADVLASNRKRLTQWEAELDAVLDACFEDAGS